jgi:putative peptidoglycan lipid II flippase
VLRHVPSVLLAISVAQIYLAINRFLASGLPHGSITALDLANRVVGLPLGIFATSLSTALFPTMSRQAARLELDALGQSTAKSLSVLLLVVIPVGAAMVLYREPIIRLLFQRGVFDAADTSLTATALYYFVFGMVGIAYNLVLTRTCYALGNVSIPIKAAVVSIAVDIILSLPLVVWLAHGGLALANSLAANVNAALLFLLLRRHLPELKPLPLARTALLTLVACVPAAAPTYIGLRLWPPASLGFTALVLEVVGLALISLVLFVAVAWALKIPEITLILTGWGKIRARRK